MKLFAKKDKTAKADKVQKQPKARRKDSSTTQILGFEKMYANGTCKLAEGCYSRAIEFSDTSFQAARLSEQEVMFEHWCELFNALDSEFELHLQIYSLKRDKQEFEQSMFYELKEGDDKGNLYRKDINNIMTQKLKDTHQDMARRRVLVIVAHTETLEEAEPQLARACEVAIQQLKTLHVEAHQMTGVERLRLINQLTNPKENPESVSYEDMKGVKNASTLDIVAPNQVSILGAPNSHSISLNDGTTFGASMFIAKFSTSVRSDFIYKLVELPINQVVSIHCHAWNQQAAREAVDRNIADLNLQVRHYRKDRAADGVPSFDDSDLPPALQDSLEQAKLARDDLMNMEQKYFKVVTSVYTFADTAEELRDGINQIETCARGFNMRMSVARALQAAAFQMALSTGTCNMPSDMVTNLMTAPMATLLPFTSAEIQHPHGVWFGQNTISKAFIMYDRTEDANGNGFIVGKSSAGKSVMAKMNVFETRLRYPKDEIICIDPDREWRVIAEATGGEVIEISATSDNHVNPFDFTIDEDDPNGGIGNKIDALISIIAEMARGLTATQATLVDRCATIIYEPYMQSRDEADIPTLKEFRECLLEQPEEEAKTLAVTIERFVTGHANTFAHKTNCEPNSTFVVYDIRNLSQNLKGLGLFILLDNIWQRVVKNRAQGKYTWIYIDEMQLLVDNNYAVKYLDYLYSRARKYGAFPTGITQNISRILDNPSMCYMLSNSAFLLMLGQSELDANKLAELLELSDTQRQILLSAQAGEGLIKAAGQMIPFEKRLPKDSELYKLTTTKLKDVIEVERV